MPHRDAIGHCDGAEFARSAVALLDAFGSRMRLAHQGCVARRRLVPTGRNANEGLLDVLGRQAHGVEIAAMRRALRPLRNVAGGHFRFVPSLAHDGPILCVLQCP